MGKPLPELIDGTQKSSFHILFLLFSFGGEAEGSSLIIWQSE